MPLTWTHLIGAGLLLTMTAGLMPVAAASIFDNKNNGYYTAKVGATCVTREGDMAPFLADLEVAQTMIRAHDHEALKKMEQAKRLFVAKAGVTVFVMVRHQNNIQVRPKGETATVWMGAHAVECPIAAAKKSK